MLYASSLELARRPLFVPLGELQNSSYLHPSSDDLLNPSLVTVTVKYSVPIILLLFNDFYYEICQEKVIFFREIHLPNLPDTL